MRASATRVLGRPRPPRDPRAGSRIVGFNQDLFEESASSDPSAEPDPISAGLMADRYPRVTELAQSVRHDGVLGPCDDDVEFAFGLDLILDGLDRVRT